MQLPIEQRNCLGEGPAHKRGQAVVQIACDRTARICGARRLIRVGRRSIPGAEERADRLRGRPMGLPSVLQREVVRSMLDIALEQHAAKRPFIAEIVRVDADEQRSVRVAAIAGMVAHAVHHHAALLAGGAHDRAAWAHTETVHVTGIFALQVLDQLVFRRAKRRMVRSTSPLGAVDHRLQVLDAHAH